MTARIGSFVVLAFATVWLWLGASALPMPWAAIVGVAGVAALLAVLAYVRRSAALIGDTGRFDRGRFAAAVVFEIVAINLVAWQLGRMGLMAYFWPALGIVVALHFVGLWWASGDRRYLTLTLTMLAVNVVACFFQPGGAAMLGVSGLGSATALVMALIGRR